MKILLVNPWAERRSFHRDIRLPPLGLAYVAGTLREAGRTVRILDLSVSAHPLSDLDLELRIFSPDLAGVTLTSPLMPAALDIAGRIKEFDRRIEVMFGGVHPTLFPETVLSYGCVDYAVRGEGEPTVLEFVQARESGKNLDGIRGLAWKRNGRAVVNPARPVIDNLDQLAWPAMDLLPVGRYSSVQTAGVPFLTMITSRGCPHDCIFCDARVVSGRRYRCHSPGRIIAEMKHYVGVFGIKEIMFKDSEFTLQPSRIEAFCEAISRENLAVKWSCNGRVGSLPGALFRRMKEAGCRLIQFGVESGDPVLLNRMKKRITPEETVKTFEDCRNAGIMTVANIIIGAPGENHASMKKTAELMRRIQPDFISMGFLTPYPGTPLYGMAVENRWLIDGFDPHRIPMDQCIMNATEWSLPELKTRFNRMQRSFYLRPSFILKRMKSTRSVEWRNNVRQLMNLLRPRV